MEDGTRPGEPKVWGTLWRALGLPLRDLYVGLQLPVADNEPGGIVGQILSGVRELTPEGQRMVLLFTRHTPSYVMAAEPPAVTTPVHEDTYLAVARAKLLQMLEALPEEQQIYVVERLEAEAASALADQGAAPQGLPQATGNR